MTFIPGKFGHYGQPVTTHTRYRVKQREDLLRLLEEKKIDSILEFGCADGTNLRYFAQKLNTPSDRLVGVDICRSTEEEYSSIEFHHKTIEEFLAEDSRKFDLAILSDVLEHIYNPWEVLQRLKEKIGDEGVLLISVPNLENLNYLSAVANGNFLYASTGLMDETHIRFFSTATLCEYMSKMGYAISNIGYRPDFSLNELRQQVEAGLMHNQSVSISLGQITLVINRENINQKFGQQILVAASNAK